MIKKISMDKLTSSEKAVYEYLKNNFYNIPVLKIDNIIESTFTSSSSIIRLAKKLGFGGWKELKKDCIQKINKFVDGEENNIVVQTSINVLKRLSKINSFSRYEKISKIIEKANNLVVYGAGINRPLAEIATHQLLAKGYYARFSSPSISEQKNIKYMTKNDVVIFISYSGENVKNIALLKNINKDVITIAITKDNQNLLTQKVKHSVLIPDIDGNYKHFRRITRLCKIMVIDSIMNAVSIKN